jgi:hypothetical protein
MIARSRATRRTFLRGAGVVLTLPWLESLAPRTAGAAESSAPRRFALIYTPNGYRQDTFVPSLGTDRDGAYAKPANVQGSLRDLPPALAPVAAVREQVTLITGLDRQFVPGTGVHAQAGACWLTSSPPQETLDGGFPTNVTLDQLLARELGRETLLPSLELSCNDFSDNKETKYFESISWYGPGYAANTEKSPRAVFERLFGKPRPATARSVLDVVLADAEALHRRLGAADRAKLDEYLVSVREVEQRMERAEQIRRERENSTASQPALAIPATALGMPEKRGDYLRLMGDLLVLAFQQDLTRVATLVVDPERWDSPRMFHGVFDKPQNHHVLTHTKGDDAKESLTKIDRFHVEFFTHLVSRLAAAREGGRSLLDACCVAMGSGISDGDSHNYRNLQVLLAGRAGGAIAPGRHLHYAGDRPLADLWLTLANLGGVATKRFADSTGSLTELVSNDVSFD